MDWLLLRFARRGQVNEGQADCEWHLLLLSNAPACITPVLQSWELHTHTWGGAFYCWELRRSAGQLGFTALLKGIPTAPVEGKAVCSLPRPGSSALIKKQLDGSEKVWDVKWNVIFKCVSPQKCFYSEAFIVYFPVTVSTIAMENPDPDP